MEHCAHMQVLIVCPTGYLVNQYKSKLPDVPGAENVRIDTIQGVLNYKRAGRDSRITWTPPSALRRIDLILLDEGSQYEDRASGSSPIARMSSWWPTSSSFSLWYLVGNAALSRNPCAGWS